MEKRQTFLSQSIGFDDWHQHPYFVREISIIKRWHALIEKLKNIPHLPLDISVDVESLLAEAEQIKQWHPHKLHSSKGFTPEELNFHEFSFQGQCLTDIQTSSLRGMEDCKYNLFLEPEAQFDDQDKLQFFVTDMGLKMPKTIETIKQISSNFNRSRVIRTPPGGGIRWHSHHNGVYSFPYMRLCIVNIPLKTNSKVIHSVRDCQNRSAKAFELNYEPGQAYIFNSWHDHEFWNHGEDERITVIPYFNFTDEDLLEFLEPKVINYSGPFING